jgi:serine/threonine protein kinase
LLDDNSDRPQDGFRYLVTEYIEGPTIVEFADQRGLDVTQRLQLFLQACAAIEHLQERPLAHLDLKPANILVNSDGVVKIVDFGNARNLEGRGVCPKSFSLPYASPEQIAQLPETGQAADIYGLGAVLYELLCGHEPFDNIAPGLLEQEIAGEHPRPPSHAALQEKVRPNATVAAHKRVEPNRVARMHGYRDAAELHRKLVGNLDCIVAFAMRKSPGRRYHSAASFRQDIEMILQEKKPPTARSGDPVFSARKMVRRRQSEIAAAGAILGVSVSFLLLFNGFGDAGDAIRIEKQKAQRASEPAIAAMRGELRRKLSADPRFQQSLTTVDASLRAIERLPRARSQWGKLLDDWASVTKTLEIIRKGNTTK